MNEIGRFEAILISNGLRRCYFAREVAVDRFSQVFCLGNDGFLRLTRDGHEAGEQDESDIPNAMLGIATFYSHGFLQALEVQAE